MEMFLFVLGALGLIVTAMSIGVIMGRKPISGSCGGMANLGMDVACDICKGDQSICETEQRKSRQTSAAQTLGHPAKH